MALDKPFQTFLSRHLFHFLQRLQTALHAAVEQNKPDTVEILLLAGSNTALMDKVRPFCIGIEWNKKYGKYFSQGYWSQTFN